MPRPLTLHYYNATNHSLVCNCLNLGKQPRASGSDTNISFCNGHAFGTSPVYAAHFSRSSPTKPWLNELLLKKKQNGLAFQDWCRPLKLSAVHVGHLTQNWVTLTYFCKKFSGLTLLGWVGLLQFPGPWNYSCMHPTHIGHKSKLEWLTPTKWKYTSLFFGVWLLQCPCP